MRRKDREMSKAFGFEVIDQCKYGIVSMIDENSGPLGLPLSIVRDGEHLYFHSAKGGTKVEIFKDNPKVGVTFVGDVKVPEVYTEEELDEIIKDESKASLLTSNVFTTEYESAIVKGNVSLVENEEEGRQAMRLLCEKYTPSKMRFFEMAVKAGLSKTNIYRIHIEEITAKRKKYDVHGEEMKWGRKE